LKTADVLGDACITSERRTIGPIYYVQVCLYLRCNCIPLNYLSDRFTVAACYGWLKSPGMASVGLKIEIHPLQRTPLLWSGN